MARQTTYRTDFTLPGGNRVRYTAHSIKERDSVALHIRNLILEKKTGIPEYETRVWVSRLQDGQLKQNLINWGLIQDSSIHEKTIQNLCDHFQSKTGVTKGTLGTFKDFGQNLLDFFGPSKKLKDITPSDASQFENFLRTRARHAQGRRGGYLTGGGLCEPTVRKRLERARQFFKEAMRLEWVTKSPFVDVHGGNAVNRSRWKYIPADVVRKVIAATNNLELRALTAISRFAGARGKSEFSYLEWNKNWINWSTDSERGTIRLFRKKTQNSGFYETICPMTDDIEKALRDLYESSSSKRGKVFRDRSNPGKVIKDLFLQNGVDIIAPYNLRRSYCRDLMESGIDPKAYEYYAGHSLKIALENYQQWDDARAKKSSERFLSAFEERKTAKTSQRFGQQQVSDLVSSTSSQGEARSRTEGSQTLTECDFMQQKGALLQVDATTPHRGYTI